MKEVGAGKIFQACLRPAMQSLASEMSDRGKEAIKRHVGKLVLGIRLQQLQLEMETWENTAVHNSTGNSFNSTTTVLKI